MKSGKCPICKAASDDLRVRTDEGCYGPVDTITCGPCHDREIAQVKSESKRFGMRLKLPKAWSKLTTRGAFTDISNLDL